MSVKAKWHNSPLPKKVEEVKVARFQGKIAVQRQPPAGKVTFDGGTQTIAM